MIPLSPQSFGTELQCRLDCRNDDDVSLLNYNSNSPSLQTREQHVPPCRSISRLHPGAMEAAESSNLYALQIVPIHVNASAEPENPEKTNHKSHQHLASEVQKQASKRSKRPGIEKRANHPSLLSPEHPSSILLNSSITKCSPLRGSFPQLPRPHRYHHPSQN